MPDLKDARTANVLDLIASMEVRAEVGPSGHPRIRAAIVAELEQHLDYAVARIVAVKADPRFDAVLKHRNLDLAHTLLRTRLEERTTVEQMRHCDEQWLLEETVIVADYSHQGLNRASFNWESARALAHRNTEYLWHSCLFTDLR